MKVGGREMITISLCMIVKDEEDTIERCLDSVKEIADEIVVVDTGSTDKTKELVSRYTDKIFDFEWIDDFSAARNYSFDQASMDYILWLDADDIILPEDAAKFLELKETLQDDIDVVMMKYNIGFDEEGRVTFTYFRERLSKRSRKYRWKEPVHEYLETYGRIINSEISITHAKQKPRPANRNINIYESRIKSGAELSKRGMYYYARELKENGRYEDAIRWYGAFLEGRGGWVEDNITACGDLALCYLELDRPEESLASMFRSFSYDIPRAETCCQIGYHFMLQEQYARAAFWFELALSLEIPKENWGFRRPEYWGYIPCIECVVCYSKLGDFEKAVWYNEKAAEYKPESQAVRHNRRYFEGRGTSG